jgi:hypothetical protein
MKPKNTQVEAPRGCKVDAQIEGEGKGVKKESNGPYSPSKEIVLKA